MPKMFKRHFNTLGFRSPRWQNVHQSVFNPAKWARYKIKHFHDLLTRFKQSPTKDQAAGNRKNNSNR